MAESRIAEFANLKCACGGDLFVAQTFDRDACPALWVRSHAQPKPPV